MLYSTSVSNRRSPIRAQKFGCVERIKNSNKYLFRHAWSGIGHRDVYVVDWRVCASAQLNGLLHLGIRESLRVGFQHCAQCRILIGDATDERLGPRDIQANQY